MDRVYCIVALVEFIMTGALYLTTLVTSKPISCEGLDVDLFSSPLDSTRRTLALPTVIIMHM